jgi:hypothetical protein
MSQGRTSPRKALKPGAGGKVANDVNKSRADNATQLHQGRRTPISRSDRLALRGADNQSQSRKGALMAPGGGRSH